MKINLLFHSVTLKTFLETTRKTKIPSSFVLSNRLFLFTSMAAQFPSNLDNGEIYHFPSDIFFNDKIFSKCTPRHPLDHPHHHHQQLCRHQFSCIDDLAHHFTALSMLQRQTLAKPQTQIPHNFEVLSV